MKNNSALWFATSLLFYFSNAVAQNDVTPMNFVTSSQFESTSKFISFEKNNCPLDYHSITRPQSLNPFDLKTDRWQHLQCMIRLPDENGNQYYMGTFSQNCSDVEGGLIFVGELKPNERRGKVIWCDELNNSRLDGGGYNHPGDLRRLGNTVVIAGQNWDGGDFGALLNSGILPGADPMDQGNGGQHVLFYDVSSPSNPRYMGKLNSCFKDTVELIATKDIDALTAAKIGDYYYLWFNGFAGGGVKCRSTTFVPDARWELVEEGADAGDSPVSYSINGVNYVGGARLKGNKVIFDKLQFAPAPEGDPNVLNTQTNKVTRVDVISSVIPYPSFGEGTTFTLNSLSNGKSSIVLTYVESDEEIFIQEIESTELAPITDVFLAFSKNTQTPSGYTRIAVDLNKGAGGNDIYLWCKRDPCKVPITAFKIEVNPSTGYIPPKYNRIPCSLTSDDQGDVNKGSGGPSILMYYSTDRTEGKPIISLDVLFRPTGGNILDKIKSIDLLKPWEVYDKFTAGSSDPISATTEWEINPVDLNKGVGGDDIFLAYARSTADAEIQSFICPENIVAISDIFPGQNNDSGDCMVSVSYIAPTVKRPGRGDCPVTATSEPAYGTPFPIGTTTVTYKANDDITGYNTTCSFTVTVYDVGAPKITCPAPVTVSCETSTAPNAVGAATATDNCELGPFTHADATIAGCCTNEFTIIRNWTAHDIHGNTNSCTQMITVNDNIVPVISCPPNITVTCDTSIVTTGIATASDNCTYFPVSSRADVYVSGDFDWLCVTDRHWVATDECLNTSKCVQRITKDVTPLVEQALGTAPLVLGQDQATVTVPPGKGACLVQWMPYSGTISKELPFDDAVPGLNCSLATNLLDESGHIVNPLLGEVMSLSILARRNPAFGTKKLSAFSCNIHFIIKQALKPDPDVNELLRVANLTLGNINFGTAEHKKLLLETLQCIGTNLEVCNVK